MRVSDHRGFGFCHHNHIIGDYYKPVKIKTFYKVMETLFTWKDLSQREHVF